MADFDEPCWKRRQGRLRGDHATCATVAAFASEAVGASEVEVVLGGRVASKNVPGSKPMAPSSPSVTALSFFFFHHKEAMQWSVAWCWPPPWLPPRPRPRPPPPPQQQYDADTAWAQSSNASSLLQQLQQALQEPRRGGSSLDASRRLSSWTAHCRSASMLRRYLLLPAYHFGIPRMCCRNGSRLRRCIAICLSSWHRVSSNMWRSIIGVRGEARRPCQRGSGARRFCWVAS